MIARDWDELLATMSNRTTRSVRRPLTIWKELGQGEMVRTPDNYGWVDYLKGYDWSSDRYEPAPKDEHCKSMPYGHHQICIFGDTQ